MQENVKALSLINLKFFSPHFSKTAHFFALYALFRRAQGLAQLIFLKHTTNFELELPLALSAPENIVGHPWKSIPFSFKGF